VGVVVVVAEIVVVAVILVVARRPSAGSGERRGRTLEMEMSVVKLLLSMHPEHV
jgi:hypothetical protein